MTRHVAPSPAAQAYAAQLYAAPAPVQRARRWALAPIITTVLAVPASLLLLLCAALSPMALDPCESSAQCPEATAAIERAVTVSALTLIPVIAVWLWPRTPRFTAARWITAAVYVGMVFVALSLFGDIPGGR